MINDQVNFMFKNFEKSYLQDIKKLKLQIADQELISRIQKKEIFDLDKLINDIKSNIKTHLLIHL